MLNEDSQELKLQVMAINRESNVYTVVFAVFMVAIVGGILAFLFVQMSPIIKANQQNEKKQNILQAIGINETGGDNYSRKDAQRDFYKYVKERITLSYDGTVIAKRTEEDSIDPKDPLDAFNIDIRKEYKLYVKKILKATKGDPAKRAAKFGAEDRIHYPLFVCEKEDSTFYVIPAVGTGLWDDVWGYIGLNSDCNTINGAVFDHKGETPGLGSKITEDWFQDQFIGKEIKKDNGEWTSIEVQKPGNDKNEHQVDGISGATFTGVGVAEMLERAFVVYQKFFDDNPEFVKE